MHLHVAAGLARQLPCRGDSSEPDDDAEEQSAQEESSSGSDDEAEESDAEQQHDGGAASASQQLECMPPASKRSKTDASEQQQDDAWALPSGNTLVPIMDAGYIPPSLRHLGLDPAVWLDLKTGQIHEPDWVQIAGQQQQYHGPPQ